MRTKIYFLLNEFFRVRYVGKTSGTLKRRLQKHIQNAIRGEKTHKGWGIRAMLRKGLLPTIVLQTEVDGDGANAEMAYIKYFKNKGVKLWNGTDGGEGCPATPAVKIKMSVSAIKRCKRGLPIVTRLKMGRSRKGHVVLPETRRKIRDGNIGLKKPACTEQRKRQISLKLKGGSWSQKRWDAFLKHYYPPK